MAHLDSHSIDSLIHYPIPAHEQTSLTNLGRDPRGLANAESHARACLSLPCHPQLTDSEVERVIAAVNSFTPA
jgi:dTDP-4-amino-4,6-dideoxygalactose transaminase